MSTNISVDHPDYRSGRGERRADREINLTGPAADAYRIWTAIWGNRTSGQPPLDGIRQDGLAAVIAAGGLRAELVQAAVDDATNRPLRTGAWNPQTSPAETERARFAGYEMAKKLRDIYTAGSPNRFLPLTPAGYNDDNTCRHGRPFSAPCADCGP